MVILIQILKNVVILRVQAWNMGDNSIVICLFKFNDILWAKAYNNNTHLKAAVRYKKTRSTTIER
jgi:hypothetical protein